MQWEGRRGVRLLFPAIVGNSKRQVAWGSGFKMYLAEEVKGVFQGGVKCRLICPWSPTDSTGPSVTDVHLLLPDFVSRPLILVN